MGTIWELFEEEEMKNPYTKNCEICKHATLMEDMSVGIPLHVDECHPKADLEGLDAKYSAATDNTDAFEFYAQNCDHFEPGTFDQACPACLNPLSGDFLSWLFWAALYENTPCCSEECAKRAVADFEKDHQ